MADPAAAVLRELLADLRAVPVEVKPTAEDLAIMADQYEALWVQRLGAEA